MKEYQSAKYISYAQLFIVNLSGLFLTPFIILNVGQSNFGLYSLIGSFIASITVFDFGLQSTSTRYIAKYKSKNEKEKEIIQI